MVEDSKNQSANVPNSSTAIIALVAGILGLTFFPLIGSIAAVIAGPRAKREIAESGGALGGESMAQIGLILGWIGLVIWLCGCCFAVAVIVPAFATMFGVFINELSLFTPVWSFI